MHGDAQRLEVDSRYGHLGSSQMVWITMSILSRPSKASDPQASAPPNDHSFPLSSNRLLTDDKVHDSDLRESSRLPRLQPLACWPGAEPPDTTGCSGKEMSDNDSMIEDVRSL